jgi:AI-2 transport protein TqsA
MIGQNGSVITTPDPGAAKSDAGGPHAWRAGMPRALVILVGAAAAVVVVAGIQATAWLIGPAFMALIVVIAVAPVHGWLQRHGWPGWATTLALILLVYGILLALALGIIFSLARLGTELPQYASKADGLVNSATAKLAELGVGSEQIKQAASSLNLGKLAGVIGALLSSVAGLGPTSCSCWRCCCSFTPRFLISVSTCSQYSVAGDRAQRSWAGWRRPSHRGS